MDKSYAPRLEHKNPDTPFVPAKDGSEHRYHLDYPAVHRRVVNKNASLLHHFFHMSQAQWIGHVPAHTGQHHFQRVVKPLEDLTQGAVNQTFAEIKYDAECRLCVLRQNHCWADLGFCHNAPTESLWGRMKVGRLYGQKFATLRQVMGDVIDWLTFYNHRRLHSTLGYVSPM